MHCLDYKVSFFLCLPSWMWIVCIHCHDQHIEPTMWWSFGCHFDSHWQSRRTNHTGQCVYIGENFDTWTCNAWEIRRLYRANGSKKIQYIGNLRAKVHKLQRTNITALTSVRFAAWNVRTWFNMRQTGNFSVQFTIRHEKVPRGWGGPFGVGCQTTSKIVTVSKKW